MESLQAAVKLEQKKTQDEKRVQLVTLIWCLQKCTFFNWVAWGGYRLNSVAHCVYDAFIIITSYLSLPETTWTSWKMPIPSCLKTTMSSKRKRRRARYKFPFTLENVRLTFIYSFFVFGQTLLFRYICELQIFSSFLKENLAGTKTVYM